LTRRLIHTGISPPREDGTLPDVVADYTQANRVWANSGSGRAGPFCFDSPGEF